MPISSQPDDTDECTLDGLCDDADLLNDALREKLQEIRERMASVHAVKEMLDRSEAKAKKDMATLMKSLRELREQRDMLGGKRR